MASNTTTTKIDPFHLSAAPGTDIWRKPPSTDRFNAPTFPSTLPTFDLTSFQRSRLTFSLPPESDLRQYDQAGMLLHLTKPGLASNETKWIKTGIEYYNKIPYVSTVGCDTWADWSIVPMPDYTVGDRPTATIEARRESDALWVYWIVKKDNGTEEARPLREIQWFFAEDGWTIGAGAFVARPVEEGGNVTLNAEFADGIEIEVTKS